MSLFSQRKGIKPLKKEFQRESIDDELKNRLWSGLKIIIWDQYLGVKAYSATKEQVELLLDKLWLDFFKQPVDTRPSIQGGYYIEKSSYKIIRDFFFESEW